MRCSTAALGALLFSLAIGSPQAHAQSSFIRANCNDDGIVNVADIIFIINYLFLNGPEGPCFDACDANDDGRLDLGDAMFIANYQFFNGPLPASPFPACGVDGTPDALGCLASMQCGPTLTGIGAREVALGSTLNIQLEAAGNSIRFAAQPLPLPANSTLNASSGFFTFTPTMDQVGTLSITFIAFESSDPAVMVSETVPITVLAPLPGAPTALSGRILDTNDFVNGLETPVVGATVSILNSGVSAVSDMNGHFTLSGVPAAGFQVMDISTTTATPAPDGSGYAGFRERIELIPGVDNVVDRPFFLPRVDSASLTTVNPATTTVVHNPNLGITMTVPPNTAKNADGSNFTGQLSISVVPEALAPASLPAFMAPGLLITIQPVGVSYVAPIPISFPNLDNLPPGSQANLWSLDPDQGTFAIFGALQVSADGALLETVSGGIVANDWHGPLPQQPNDNAMDQQEEGDNNSCEQMRPVASSTGLHSGRLVVDHTLASYQSAGANRSLRLVYNSTSADPQPLIKSLTSLAPNTGLPGTLSTELTLGGLTLGAPIHTSTTNAGGTLQGEARLVHQLDAAMVPTGSLPYLLKVNSHYPQTTISRFRAGAVLVNNQRSSPFGAGWTLAGLQRLHLQAGGTKAVLTEGDGSIKTFTPQQSLQGVATDLAFVLDGSGSVSGASFAIQTEGLAAAIENPLVVPPDGSVAFAVVQFSSAAVIEVPLTLIDSPSTSQAVAQQVRNIVRIGGGTAIHAGLNSATAALGAGSPGARQVICLSTDGGSNVQQAIVAAQSAVAAGVEEIDTIGIGTGINAALLQQIATIGSGVFVTAATFQEFANIVDDKLQAVIGGNPPGEFSFVVRNSDGSFTRQLKDGTRIEFDASGLHVATVERTGEITSYAYDAAGCLASIQDPMGLTTQLHYQGGKLTSIVDPAGRLTSFQVDAAGCLTAITDPDGSARQFGYDSRLRMTSQTSKLGALTSYAYDFSGRQTAATLANGAMRSITPRDAIGLVNVASGMGSPASPAPFVAADEAMGEYQNSTGGLIRVRTNSFGSAIAYTDEVGNTTSFVRDSDNLVTRIEYPNGRIDEQQYDGNGNLVQLTEAVGTSVARTTLYQYAPGRDWVTQVTDGEGHTTAFEYDAAGNLTRVVNPDATERTFAYSPSGRLLMSVDENGNPTAYSYDSMGILETATNARGEVTRYTRDSRGNVLSITEGEGTPEARTRLFTYDALDRVLAATDGAGGVTAFSYDAAGNLLSTILPTGEMIVRAYDALAQLVALTDPLRGTTVFTYDGDGRLTSRTDARGLTTAFAYDGASRLASTTDPAAGMETYGYDASGSVVSFQNAGGHATTFQYDVLDRRTRMTTPSGRVREWRYDRTDNLTRETPPGTSDIVHSYDGRGRRLTTMVPAVAGVPGNAITFSYDPVGNLRTVFDNDTRLERTYDALNRVLEERILAGGLQPITTLASSYNAVGDRTLLVDSAGGSHTYGHDGAGRLTTVMTPEVGAIGLSYDPSGRLRTVAFPNGVTGTYDYLPNGRLSGITHAPVSGVPLVSLAYQTGPSGNIDAITDAGVLKSYGYDPLDRLTVATEIAPAAYSYDPVGNRIQSDSTSTALYNDDNQLLSDDTGTYQYDPRGNLVQFDEVGATPPQSYRWDAQNQLVEVVGVSQYRYDGLGRRVEKVVGTVTRRYVYDGDNVLLEFDASGQLHARYTHGEQVDQHLAMARGGAAFYYHTDQLGSVRSLTDATGTETNRYRYDPYGRVLEQVEGTENPFWYTGREEAQELGWYYYRARWYDSRAARFCSEDPLQSVDLGTPWYSLESAGNAYRYVGADPIGYVDPHGREKFKGIMREPVYVHPRDPDPFPSDPHGHIGSPNSSKKLNIETGEVFDGTRPTGQKIGKKRLRRLQELLQNKKLLKKIPFVGIVFICASLPEQVEAKGLGPGLVDAGLDAIPYFGLGKGVYEEVTGVTLIPEK
ncbi:MAG: VWA domain-containing protein [Dehalococcoidia bacterium]